MNIANCFFRTFMLVLLSVLLGGCGGGSDGGGDGPTAPPTSPGAQYSTAISPLYTAGENWNDYVKDDGTQCFSTDEIPCSNGGLMRAVYAGDKTSCNGLTATDALDAFNWECDPSKSPVLMFSTGFNDGKGLSDLIDFDNGTWLPNKLIVRENNAIVFETTLAIWWNNPIETDNGGNTDNMTTEGKIYIVTQDTGGIYILGTNKISLLIDPRIILSGSLKTVAGLSFVWVEGALNAASSFDGIGFNFYITHYSTLNNVTVSNASMAGVKLSSSSNNTLKDITVTGSGSGNGVWLNSSSKNTLVDITTTGRSYGVFLVGSSENTLSGVAASSNSTGVSLSSFSNDNILQNITATNNSDSGVSLNASSRNSFTGELTVGGTNSINCFVGDLPETEPGLVDNFCTTTGVEGSSEYGLDNWRSTAILRIVP